MIGLCHLSIPFVVAISAIYLGRPVVCPATLTPSIFLDKTSKLLKENSGTAVLIGVDEQKRIIVLLYFFKGSCIKIYRSDGSAMVPSNPNVLTEIPSDKKVQFTAYIHSEDLLEEGYGVPIFPLGFGGDTDGSAIGARKHSPKPSGETSIALELPKNIKEDEESGS